MGMCEPATGAAPSSAEVKLRESPYGLRPESRLDSRRDGTLTFVNSRNGENQMRSRVVIEVEANTPHHKRAVQKFFLELAKADEAVQKEVEARIAEQEDERELKRADVEAKKEAAAKPIEKAPESAPVAATPQPAPAAPVAPEPAPQQSPGFSNGGDEPVPASFSQPAPAPAPAPLPAAAPNQPFTGA